MFSDLKKSQFDAADDADIDLPPANEPTKTATTLLTEAVLDATLRGRLRRRFDAPGVVAVVLVPDAGWTLPIDLLLEHRYPGALVVAADGQKKSYGTVNYGASYGTGRKVFAVTHDVALLPEEVRAAVDLTVVLDPPDAEMVRKVIKHVTGGRVRGLADSDLGVCSLADLAAAIRPYSSAAECVARIKGRRTVAPTSAGPDLGTLPVFGQAKVWADQALQEADRLLRGEICAQEVEATLLYGPPGTGKTVLAGALAKSANMTLVATSVADWFVQSDGNLGGVLRKGEAFFQQVLASAPALGFLDEIDALPDREVLDPDRREWWQSLLTGVLLMVTRTLSSNKQVMLVAATNHIGHLDAALKRAGRFGRHVPVRPAETEEEIAAILKYHLRDDLEAEAIAQLAAVAGVPTAAEVEAWVKAARSAARAAARPLTVDDVLGQLAPERDGRSAAELRLTALHEAAHAVAAMHFGFELKKVTVTGTGSVEGSTTWRPTGNATRLDSIENQAVVTLAGRAADLVLGDGADGGAVADLATVTNLLVAADATLGLRDALVSRGEEPHLLLRTDPALVRRTDDHLKRLLARAINLVDSRRDEIVAVAAALLSQRILSGADVNRIIDAAGARKASRRVDANTVEELPIPDEPEAAAAQPREF